MRFNYISRMIVILSFFFFNKVNIFSEINNYVKVKYENITLWDLTPQLVEKSKAENIILGKIKVPGGKYIIKADKIKAELLKLGVKVVKIPDTITVERDFSEVKTAEVEAELLKVLQKDKTDFDYNVVINSRDTLKMPTGNIEYRVEENKVDKLGKNQNIASVYENNIKVYEFPFSLNTGKLIKEYTLIKDVKKGESYKEDKVSVKSEMVYEETKLKNLEINEKTIFTEDLYAGTKLQPSNIEIAGTIKKGQKISVEINYGSLTISDRGEALQSGEFGQEIEVKNLRTGKILKGTVVSENIVEIKQNE